MEAPQKKFLGKTASTEKSICGLAAAGEVAVPAARDETVQPEKAAGSRVVRPAAKADCANSRRVRDKVERAPLGAQVRAEHSKPEIARRALWGDTHALCARLAVYLQSQSGARQGVWLCEYMRIK